MKRTLALISIVLFLGSCAQPQNACGTKKQHKKRVAKMKSIAPSMTR